jgi:hypothetical protein
LSHHPVATPNERYQEGKRLRSAGILPTKRRAEAERRALERGRRDDDMVVAAEADPGVDAVWNELPSVLDADLELVDEEPHPRQSP